MISVVIATRNTRQLTLDCLESLTRTVPHAEWEAVVVDNASSDSTPEVVRERFPQVDVLRNSGNVGFGRACNQGVARSRGEYLLFLNSDTVVPAGAVDALVRAMSDHPHFGVVAPRLEGPDGEDQETAAVLTTPAAELFSPIRKRGRRLLSSVLAGNGELGGIGYLCGAAILVRREAFEAVGGFDESFYFYFEDADLCRCIADKGWGAAIVREARITHVGGASTSAAAIGPSIEMMRSRIHYIGKHYGYLAAAAVGTAHFLGRCRRAVTSTLGVLATLGMCRKLRHKARLNVLIVLWLLLGMPGRRRWVYRRFFSDWQDRAPSLTQPCP